jgi:hypothetical protein
MINLNGSQELYVVATSESSPTTQLSFHVSYQNTCNANPVTLSEDGTFGETPVLAITAVPFGNIAVTRMTVYNDSIVSATCQIYVYNVTTGVTTVLYTCTVDYGDSVTLFDGQNAVYTNTGFNKTLPAGGPFQGAQSTVFSANIGYGGGTIVGPLTQNALINIIAVNIIGAATIEVGIIDITSGQILSNFKYVSSGTNFTTSSMVYLPAGHALGWGSPGGGGTMNITAIMTT